MKKNISINISGIIFHIEEDGYEALRKYLDSINQYFGSFEDSSEILSDIESRIAEIFLSKLNEGKQVITSEDVQSLMTIMGNVNDFKAAEQQEVAGTDDPRQQQQSQAGTGSATSSSGKRLFRDQKRKILGGVCAGLGHYFNIDPIWPRLLFALAVLGTSGVLLLLYIILWIVLPVSGDLEDEPNVKKMFRNPDSKVIGGVASGVAAFFGTDVVVIRLLFVVFTIFFGTGLVVYIVLWIALPEAKTITDKMKMQGEPVTLSNIESSVKKGLNEKDQAEESTLAKIILFPFRVLAAILNALGRVLGPILRVLLDVVRVGIGVVISLLGFGLIVALIFAFGIMFGFFSVSSLPEWWDAHTMGLPLEPIRQAFPTWTAIFAFTAVLIPALFILLIGNSIIAKKIVFRPFFGWTLFVLFFVSVAFLSFSIPQLVYRFKEDGDHKVEQVFNTSGTPVLRLHQSGLDDYNVTDLNVHGYDGSGLKLTERFAAQGSTKMNARENAQQVDYQVVQNDSIIAFDSNITFKKDAQFRFQRLYLDLSIPFDQPFVIEEEMWDFIDNLWRYDYYYGHENAQTFKFNKNGKLECLSCPTPPKDLSGLSTTDEFGLKDFNEIEMNGAFDAVIQQGDEYAIQLDGSDAQKQQYKIGVKSETLEVNYRTNNKSFWKDNLKNEPLTEITITLPSLRKLKITGAGKIKLRGFHEQDTEVSFVGAWVADARISSNQLAIEATGPVVLELDGDGDYLEATLSGPCQLKASNYSVNRAVVEAHGLAQARLNVSGTLEIDKDFTSNVRYSGNPELIKHE